MTEFSFSDFNLDKKILKALEIIGYKTPTDIQQHVISKIMNGRDIIASAQTGTGKTAAFLLPILHLVTTNYLKNNGPSVLILVPTRELAIQVFDEARKFSKFMPEIKIVNIYGGVPYPMQRKALSSRHDIIIATPGRLMDHMEQGRINLSNLKLLVLDEADRMLDMGFVDAVEDIASATPKDRQTLLFSATIDRKILPISKKLQNQPDQIQVNTAQQNNVNIDQRLYYVDNLHHKLRLLDHILADENLHQTIVFTSTKMFANELAEQLKEKGHLSGVLHGDLNQRQRTKTIERMRKGNIDVLIATDVAARGLDINTLGCVINFDLPQSAEDFIHRIGRTGRAGASGIAITFVTYKEDFYISKVNALLGTPIKSYIIEGLEPQPKQAAKKNRGPNNHFQQRNRNNKQRYKKVFSNV